MTRISLRDICLIVACIVGLLLTVLGITLHFKFPDLMAARLKKTMNLRREGPLFERWMYQRGTLESSYYFFHVLNPEEAAQGAKVQLQEVGPYVFRQSQIKELLNYSAVNETATYNEKKTYHFVREKSIGDLDENVTVVNTPLATVVSKAMPKIQKMGFFGGMALRLLNGFLHSYNQHMFVNATVGELLTGLHIEMLDSLSTLTGIAGSFSEDLMKKAQNVKTTIGIISNKNDTFLGPYTVYLGLTKKTQPKVYTVKSWAGKEQFTIWKENGTCNNIKGSTHGGYWAPMMKKEAPLYSFVPDLCVVVGLKFKEESSYKGIKTWTYEKINPPEEVDPDENCYCVREDKEFCQFPGAIDVSRCFKGTPMYYTNPYFVDTSPKIRSNLEGVNPDPKRHRLFVKIIPELGLLAEVKRTMQMAFFVPKYEDVYPYEHLKENMLIPLFWIDEYLGLSDEIVAQINKKTRAIRLAPIVIPLLIACGVLLMLIAIVMFFFLNKKKSKQQERTNGTPRLPEEYGLTETENHENNKHEANHVNNETGLMKNSY